MTSDILMRGPREVKTGPAVQRFSGWSLDRAWPVVVTVLGALYLLQTLSPMRLDNDSVVYLRMAASLVDGVPMEKTGLPPGYPALVAVLEMLGMGRYFVFVMVNIAFIAMGLAAAQYLFGKREFGRRSWVVPLTMLAVALIRYMPMPLPESMFFGVSMVAVAVMTAATRSMGGRRAKLLALALMLTIVAITVRLVGLALVPAMIWACCRVEGRDAEAHPNLTRREQWLGAVALLSVAIVILFVLGDSLQKYSFEAMLRYVEVDRWSPILLHLRSSLWTFGGVVLNLPLTQFRPYRPAFLLAGLGTVIWILGAVRLRPPRTPGSIYLASFITLLVLWPYTGLRLWLPIVPLLIGYMESASFRFTPGRKWKMFVRAYVAWFAVAGLGALAYTTRITLSGENFPNVYGRAGGMSFPDWTTGRIDTLHNQRALQLLERYGSRF